MIYKHLVLHHVKHLVSHYVKHLLSHNVQFDESIWLHSSILPRHHC